MRAGLFHPTTGYSLPDAVRLAVSDRRRRPTSAITALVELTHAACAAQAWAGRGFYRALDTMLFRAAEPDQRYQVLERFYRLSPDLIAALLRRRVDGGPTSSGSCPAVPRYRWPGHAVALAAGDHPGPARTVSDSPDPVKLRAATPVALSL